MPWTDSGTILSTKEKIEIDTQDGLVIKGYQPFATLVDANDANKQARIQNAGGNLVFYVHSALNAGLPSVVFNTLEAPSGKPPPTAILVNSQDGMTVVGYQPFITLSDANAGYPLCRIQNAGGDMVFYTPGRFAGENPGLIVKNDGTVHVAGVLTVDTDIKIGGGDCAEEFETADGSPLEPGTVVSLDGSGGVRTTEIEYDKKVAGIVSGAGAHKPGIVLNRAQRIEGGAAVALAGRVYCKVDADFSPVAIGDLLTSSATPGHAMKASDPARAFGSVIGKALGTIRSGRGLLPVLVSLQ